MRSELWNTLWQMEDTTVEHKYKINGAEYGKESEIGHSIKNQLYDKFGIGNAACAELDLKLIAEDIPRSAKIEVFVRLVNGTQVSEWQPGGVFFVNHRAFDDDVWTLEAYDVMRKGDIVWEPDQSLKFPMPMPDAVEEFARIMRCEIDERTVLNPAYTIDYPANDYTLRDELMYIAAAHGGNWIVTNEGKLLLVPLLSMPEETFYLIEEHGYSITLGGDRILVR